MDLRRLLIADAALTVPVALALLVAPAPLIGLFGISGGPSLLLVARLLAAMMLGHGVIAWQARDHLAAPALRAVMAGQVAVDLAGGIAFLHGAASGACNGLGWPMGALFLLFSIPRIRLALFAPVRGGA